MGLTHADRDGEKAWCGYVWPAQWSEALKNGSWDQTTCIACLMAGRKEYEKYTNTSTFLDKQIARVHALIPSAPDTEADLWE